MLKYHQHKNVIHCSMTYCSAMNNVQILKLSLSLWSTCGTAFYGIEATVLHDSELSITET